MFDFIKTLRRYILNTIQNNAQKKQDIIKYILPFNPFFWHYNLADSSLPALNLATFLALILITAPV